MKLNDVIFIDNLPKLDLHGLDRDTARVKIKEFINDQFIMKNNLFVIYILSIKNRMYICSTHISRLK